MVAEKKPRRKKTAQKTRSGAPAKFDVKKTREGILRHLRKGHFIETAASLEGVAARTLRAWIARGKRALARFEDELEVAEEDRAYLEFAQSVDRAVAYAEDKALTAITKAGDENWLALKWRLERRFPDRWGPKAVIQHGIQEGARENIGAVVESLRAQPDGRKALEALYRGVEGLAGHDGDGDDEGSVAEKEVAAGGSSLADQ